MQPMAAEKEHPPQSQLLDSLRVYLNNKKRLQPIIGLSSIIECGKAGTLNREVLFLCEVCMCRLSKADIRNHIMGSLHRYNYIRVRRPDLASEWKENLDLSKLAWTLMDIAKMLEDKEGPGDVQLLEIEDCVYQTLASFSESDAVALIQILRNGSVQNGHESLSGVEKQESIQSQRTVLLSDKSRANTNNRPSLMQSALTKSESCFNNTSSSRMDHTQTTSDPFMQTENSSSYLDGYAGTEPLIGLSRVVECKGEDGQTYCFLCHCCRIRSNNQDIIDHLSSSSHLVNYVTETRPEQAEVMMVDVNSDYRLLQSLAWTVEQEEGGGELRVIRAPESLCVHLAGKSYHWCIKMLRDGWTQTDILKRKKAAKGPNVNIETEVRATTVQSQHQNKRKSTQKIRKKTNTVFKVSLPLTEGLLLLERTSFSMDTIPVSPSYSPPSDSDLNSLPKCKSEDCELDCDANLEPEGNITTCLYQEGNTNQCDYEDSNQYEHISGRTEQHFYEDSAYNTFEEESGYMMNKEQSPAQSEWSLPPGCHAQEWASCYASHGWGDWYQSYYASYGWGQWYQSNSQSQAEGVEVPRDITQGEWSSYAPSYSYNYPTVGTDRC
ncbi:uncharacterized protein si:ch211-199g17.2 isoform X1 [Cheilinus undulatus]|uniref:uncharacterized protein si:ch211-199g17.2 isoform X1 n=1 Tax=Cheilinus undulatus TaxID=241271 RepID=UPI001BD263BB|nr:uncharacterized protein si:ch211-199g17.2 isoform X1 [Cheilinus undulatus]